MPDLELTKSQRDAIESTDELMAVVAGAGSGKTMVLIDRSLKIIGESGSGLSSLLAITFTEKAAGELKAKLRKRLKPQMLPRLSSAWIGTFHAFCARLLRQNAPACGLDPSFYILDENGARMLAHRAVEESFLELLDGGDESAAILVEEIEYKNAIGTIDDLMSFRWHAQKIFEAEPAGDENEKRLIRAAGRCFAAANERLGSRMTRMNAIDFQGIEISALELLEDSHDVLSQYRKRFRHILVDEYQDTNDIQTELVKLLFDPPHNKLFIVGDPRQSIYRFRGANVSCFAAMTEHIRKNGGRAISLAENFRSRPGIIDFVNRASVSLEESLFKKGVEGFEAADAQLKATRPKADRPDVTVLSCISNEDAKVGELRAIEAAAIARHIKKIVSDGVHGYGDIVCLFQAITATEAYETAFRRHGIPYRVYGGRHLLDRPEIADLVAALNFAADTANDTALLTIVRSPLIGLSDDECAILAGESGKEFKRAVRNHPAASGLISRLEGAAVHRRPSEILRMVLDLTGYEVFCARSDSSGTKQANIDKLVSMAESIEAEAPVSLASFVDFMRELREESARLGDPPAAGESGKLVRCMTVHAAKGMQFPVVILPDLVRQPVVRGGTWVFVRGKGLGFKRRDPEMPFGDMIASDNHKDILLSDRIEEEIESRRLLYVAMTRARESLVFPIHNEDKSSRRWQSWIKPFVDTKNDDPRGSRCHPLPIPLPSLRLRSGQAREREHVVTPPQAAGNYLVEIIEAGHECESGEKGELRESGEKISSMAAFTRPTNRVRTFTVSELESFERCPQEYYLKYVASVPAETILAKRSGDIPASVRGSIIHGVMEVITPDDKDRVEDLVKTQCLKNQISPDAAAVRNLSKPILAFCADPLFAELADSERELAFNFKTGRNIIAGKIDYLKKLSEGLTVIDFKTDRIKAGEVTSRAENYNLQMTAYALAAETMTNGIVRQTTLYFLDPQKTHTVPMDAKRRKSGLALIESIIGRITQGDYEIGSQIPPCAKPGCRCPYHLNHLCWMSQFPLPLRERVRERG